MPPRKKPLVLAGTGHRPDKLGGHWNPTGFAPALKVVKDYLIDRVQHCRQGQLEVVSGMALGFDMILAAAAMQARNEGHKIRIVAALPFEGQELIWTDKTALAWYARLREKADEVVIVNEKVELSDKRAVVVALNKRNEYMVKRSDIIVACWNGEKKGGTWNTIKYAKELKNPRPVENLYIEIGISLGIVPLDYGLPF